MATPYLQIQSTGAFVDATGAALAAGTLLIQSVDGSGNAIPFRVGSDGSSATKQATKTPIQRTITSGAIDGGLQLANPALTSPENIGFTFTVTDAASGVVTTYPSVLIQDDGSGNWNIGALNTGQYIKALPMTIVQGPAGSAGARGADGAAGPVGPRGFSGAPISGTIISGTFPTTERNFFAVQNSIEWAKDTQNNQNYQQAAFFSQNDMFGYGWSYGSDWSIGKSALFNYRSTVRGIHQGIFNSFEAYGEGDKAGIYTNMAYCGGPSAFNDEGVTGLSSQVFEATYDFFGTVRATTGAGDINPGLTNTSGSYYTFDGGILCNMTKSPGIAGQLTGYSAQLENYLNYLPVNITSGGPGAGKLPTLHAWAVFGGSLGGNAYPAAHLNEVTIPMTPKPLADGSTPLLTNGHARLGGAYGLEQVILYNVQGLVNGTQNVTFKYRVPNGSFYLFQSDISDTYISFDARANTAGANGTPSGQMSAYPVMGSLHGTDMIYLLKHNGITGYTVPFGDSPSVTDGVEWGGYRPKLDGTHPFAGFHLYAGAEVVGIPGPSNALPQPEIEQNRIVWAVGDSVQSTHPPSGGGGYAHWLKHFPQTPVRPGFAHENLRVESGGLGVANNYAFITATNTNKASNYFSNGGPLGKPNGIVIGQSNDDNGIRRAIVITNAADPLSMDSEASVFTIRQDSSYTGNLEWSIMRLPHGSITYWHNDSVSNANGNFGDVDNQWYVKFPNLAVPIMRAYFMQALNLVMTAQDSGGDAIQIKNGRLRLEATTAVLVNDGSNYQYGATENVTFNDGSGTAITLKFVKGIYIGRS